MRFNVGNWIVEPGNDRILKGDEQRQLRPQVMDILVYLASRRGKTVSNEEMMAELWAGKIVTPGTLYNAVNELRQALDDDAQNPKYIKTIPKRGYRLVAEVREIPQQDNSEFALIMSNGETAAIAPPDNRLNWAGATVTLAMLVILVWTMALPYLDRNTEFSDDNRRVSPKSIAVLPFNDMSEENDQEYFAHGLSEEILNRLAQLPELKVTGRISSFSLRETKATIPQIGELLGVGHVLEGSVRKDGDNIRVTAQLINAQDGYHVWSKVYERQLTELFQVQDDIAEEIVDVLELSLSDPGSNGLLPRAFQPDFQAHDYYLRALEWTRQQTRESLQAARDALAASLELDPEFAAAHVAMAQVIIDLDNYVDIGDKAQASVVARRHIDTALRLEPDLASAWTTLGMYYLSLADEEEPPDHVQQAENALLKAIELNPADSSAHYILSWVDGNRLVSWASHVRHLERAVEIDPLWTEPATQLALRLWYLPHRADQSAAIFDRLQEVYPDKPRIQFWKAYWFRFQGRLAEAIRSAEASLIGDSDFGFANLTFKQLWYHIGEPGKAFQIMGNPVEWQLVLNPDRKSALNELIQIDRELQNQMGNSDGSGPWVAYAYLMLGQPREALRALGYEAGSQELEFPEGFDFLWASNSECPLITMATSFKLLGETALFEQSLAKEIEALNIRSENGTYKNAEYWRVMARAHALRGEDYAALLALERLTADGPLDPRELMHPAYDEIRNMDEFKKIVEKRAGLINQQRVLLGLDEKDMVAYQGGSIDDQKTLASESP